MSRYIDAEPIEKFITDGLNNQEKPYGWVGVEILTEVHYAPTEDVAPVVHGHWETIYNDCGHYGFVKCTACGDEYGSLTYRYCPNCGAKMDKLGGRRSK